MRMRAIGDAFAALGLAVLVAAALLWAAARVGPLYPAERARMLATGWSLVALAAFIACLLAREGSLLARLAGAAGVDALAIEGYALLVPRTFWYGAARAPAFMAEHGGAALSGVLFRDFLASTMVAGLVAACAGLAFALWRPNRGTGAAAGLILLVLAAAFASGLAAQGHRGVMI